ncbi:MAG: hypothetical protein O3B87_01900 [bacterium]|nr:hypothetical protein [bacterium]
MNIDKRVPTSLKIVAGLYILLGVNSLWQMISSISQNSFSINFGFMALFVGYGLLKLKNVWRKSALIISWLIFLMIAIIGIILRTYPETVNISMLGGSGDNIPKTYGYVILAIFFLINLWQYRILTNKEIKSLFK